MNNIEFVRGDTRILEFEITDIIDQNISKDEIDTLFMTVRQYPDLDSKIIFEKQIDDFTVENGLFEVTIEPEDTESLRITELYYDFEITLKNRYRHTEVGTITLIKDSTIHGKG